MTPRRAYPDDLPTTHRPSGVVAGQISNPSTTNREEPTMTSNSTIVPNHQDCARAMRVVLAMLVGDLTDVTLVAAEARNAADVHRLFRAAAACFAAVLRRRHGDPTGHIAAWIAHELSQDDPADAADDSIVPTHTDRTRALSSVQAVLHDDWRTAAARFAEATTPRSVDRFLLALCDSMQMFLKAKLNDPAGYVESWIATELQLANTEDGPAYD